MPLRRPALPGFTLVTQLGVPAADNVWSKTAVDVTECMAMVLLLGGAASLLAEVAEKIRETGEWRGARKWGDD